MSLLHKFKSPPLSIHPKITTCELVLLHTILIGYIYFPPNYHTISKTALLFSVPLGYTYITLLDFISQCSIFILGYFTHAYYTLGALYVSM